MPFPICLQDWITVHGYQQAYIATQSDSSYVDLTDFQDFAVYAEISSNTNTTLTLQGSPTREAAYFSPFNNQSGVVWQWTSTSGLGIQAIQTMRFIDAGAPVLAPRILRWSATGTAAGAWDITFRIWLSLNQSAGSM